MLQATTGSLLILDPHLNPPKVFWRGAQLAVESVLASNGNVLLRVKRGSLPAETMGDLASAGINVKETQ